MSDQVLDEPVDVSKRELRVYEGASYWKPEIQPQPDFGQALCDWMKSQKLSNKELAQRVGCSDSTIGSWRSGNVPSKDMREKLVEAGYTGQFHFIPWTQDMFISSELVNKRNPNYNPETDDPEKEFYQKYLVRCRMPVSVGKGTGKNRVVETTWEEKEFLFSTRVSDVVGCVQGDDDSLKDWVAFQGLAEALGEPVLTGIHPVDGEVEIRGSYRRIYRNKKNLTNPKMVLDTSRGLLKKNLFYSNRDLLEIHERAWHRRWAKRNEAGLLGTRAHFLGQAWIQFHALQARDYQGIPQIDLIYAPRHFWYANTDDETIEAKPLANEPKEVQKAIEALQFFWVSNRLTVVSTEELFASLVYGVAGAVDCLCHDKDGNLLLLDWKTSGGIYPKMFNQVTWYAILCHICRGEWPQRAYVVRLDKVTAAVEVLCVYDNEKTRKKRVANAFVVLEAYRGNEELELELDSLKKEATDNG